MDNSENRPGRPTRYSASRTSSLLKYQPDAIGRRLDNARRIVKVLIAIDFGTQATKAVFMVTRQCHTEDPKLLEDDDLFSQIDTIGWDRGATECPTQIALGENPDGTSFITYWGLGVDDALHNGEISEKDILRGIKATVFATENNKSNHHLEQLMQRIEALSSTQTRNGTQFPILTPHKIWMTFQTKAFSFILAKIRRACGSDLPWPLPDPTRYPDLDYTETFNLSDFPDCVIEVALPIPAGLSVEHSQLALASARAAGLPNCYLVAEPASVAAYVAQADYQKEGDEADFRPSLIVDHGCGTVDLTLTTLSTDRSARNSYQGSVSLREVIPGIMQWCGGDFANKAFREMIKHELDINNVVKNINDSGLAAVPFTYDIFLDYLDRQFEVGKKKFDGTTQTRLPLPRGALDGKYFNLSVVSGLLIIPSDMMREIFSHTLTGVVKLIDGQLKDFMSTLPSYQRDKFPVKRIVLAGGGNENPYISRFLCDRYERGHYDEAEPYPQPSFLVEVLEPSIAAKALLMTVHGALLLLLDKQFVGSRVARRGYCFAWDEFQVRGRPYVDDQIVHNEMVGDYMAQDAAKFVLKIGKVIKGRFKQTIRGTRGLWLDEATPDGWVIEEVLWYTDKREECRDGLWVRCPQSTFQEAGTVTFNLEIADTAQFKTDMNARGRRFKCLEYEVTLVIENMEMEFEITIPRSGSFDDEDGMQELIQKKAKLDCGHIFETYTTSNVMREY